MTWVKLSDDALDDPQVVDLPAQVIVDYLRALGWSNRWARDGRVPAAKAGASGPAWVTAGLATELEDGYQLDWLLGDQPTAREIEERRKDDRQRQERRRRHLNKDHSLCDPTRCKVLLSRRDTGRDSPSESRDPDPTRPAP